MPLVFNTHASLFFLVIRVIVNWLHQSIVAQLVRHLDVVKRDQPFCIASDVRQPFDPISFEKLEKVFGACVDMRSLELVYAGKEILFAEKRSPVFASKLKTLIRVDHDLMLI